jgi:hypothetical protein
MRVLASDGRVQTDRRSMQRLIVLGAVGILIGLSKEYPPSVQCLRQTSKPSGHLVDVDASASDKTAASLDVDFLIVAPDDVDVQLSGSLNTVVSIHDRRFGSLCAQIWDN